MKKFWSISSSGDYVGSVCGIPAALIIHFYADCGHLFAILSLFSLAAMLPVNYWPGSARGKKGSGDTYQETTFSNVPLHSDWTSARQIFALREELDFFPEDAFDEFAKRHCMGSAFIIFDSTATRNAFVQVVRGQTCIGRIVNTAEALSRRGFREKPLSSLLKPERPSSESLDPVLQNLKLRSAPEPDDLIWQNLAYQPYTSSVILPSIGVTAVYLALSRIEQSGGRSYIESFLYKVSGTFFISYVCQRAFLGAIVDITRCADLVAAQPWIHSRSVTDVEVQRALRPSAFAYGHDYALVLSIFLVVLLGTVITPVITPIGALFFYLKCTTTKYNMLYVLPYSPGRGHIASTVYWLTFVCLVIFEVVMSFVFLEVAGRKHFVAMIVLLSVTCAVYFSRLSGTEAIALVQQGFADLRGDTGATEYEPIATSEAGDTEYKSITVPPPTSLRRTLLGLSRRSIFGPKPTDLQHETALIASYADPYKAALSIFKLLGVNQFHQMTSTRTQLRYAFIRLRRWSQRPIPVPEPKKKKWWQRKEKSVVDTDKERGVRGWWRRHHKDKHDSL
ncbi:hypothetical protein BBJ29_007228 [Phytophthora kernoviae]|uniref:CSC1/OSCA1-like 7TM region domain-containing protein n=1 Tax=Phytophthora kernoviae TaxID=325452 RepID=A0A3F2S3K6_9STRA|nr:hypothetical protein BBJ29_007228 [Phytophthora kernoviae]RLN69386.1 hypothetical protein BBP00_00000391 [Phytophthora kernoviae]